MVKKDKKKEKPLPYAKLYPNWSMKKKYDHHDIHKIGYLDIETTNLDADFGFMLSWAMVVRDTQTNKVLRIDRDVITKKDIDECIKNSATSFDKNIIISLFEAIDDIDLLVGHYFHGWRKMDMPFIRARAILCKVKGMKKHRQVRYTDTWKMAHLLYKVHSYRLDVIGELFGVKEQKTRIDYKFWQLARYGHKKSLKYVLDHNIKDVQITHKVHQEMEEYMPVPAGYI